MIYMIVVVTYIYDKVKKSLIADLKVMDFLTNYISKRCHSKQFIT